MRKAMPSNVRVVRAGISMRGARERIADVAISCGVAGGLRDDLPTGTVLIPRTLRRPDGTNVVCDPQLVESLLTAARRLGHTPIDAPLFTATALVHGATRKVLAAEGFAGVDMESGLVDADRLACVRVILDTPQHEISSAWEKPASVVFHPSALRDLPFLAREGPRCAALAASVIAYALSRSEAR